MTETEQPWDQPKDLNGYVRYRIRRLRLEKGLKTREVAERSGIALGSYSCLETGRYRINLKNLFRILAALGVPIGEVWPDLPDAEPVDRVTERHFYLAIEAALRREGTRLNLEDILSAVVKAFDAERGLLAGRSRQQNVVGARAAAVILTRQQNHLTLIALGQMLNRDPSSLTHSVRRIGPRGPENEEFWRRVESAQLLLLQPVSRKSQR